jgi:formate hydrogenlyase subunit 6/NADH:ubiquinone oxidoreductase subunit I
VKKSSQAKCNIYKKKGGFQDKSRDSAKKRFADMSNFLPQIDAAKCIGCELCVKLCPNEALAMAKDVAVINNPAACDYSSACQEICPTQAISLMYELVF